MSGYAWNCRDEGCPDEIVAIGFGEHGGVYAMCPGCMASQIVDGGLDEQIVQWSGTHILTATALAELGLST